MAYQDIRFMMEILGTAAFAASGAMTGIGKKMDVFGVCVLGVITSVGGGIIRDVILGITPPGTFYHPVYTVVAAAVSLLVFLLFAGARTPLSGGLRGAYDHFLLVTDTVGLGVFTVVGVETGIMNGYLGNTFLLVFLGTVTGVGGGLLRDMMAGVPPYIFVKHIYACASIAGALLCTALYPAFGRLPALTAGAAIVMLIRFLAAYYHWNLPKAGR